MFVVLAISSAQPKDVPVNAVVLYDDSKGAAYAQIAGLTINGKTELRSCEGTPKISKKTYGKLPKVSLRTAKSLEKTSDGRLMLLAEGALICVVPGSLNFDSRAEYTAAEAASTATLQGSVFSSSAAKQGGDIPQFKPGVRLVFVATLNIENAEYLRAQRGNSIEGWNEYLRQYSASPHTADAKNSLATLYANAGQGALAAYSKSVSENKPDLTQLREAQKEGEQSLKVIDGFSAARDVLERVRAELVKLVDADSAKLQAYRQALSSHSAGYLNLTEAQKHNEQVITVNSKFDPALALKKELDANAAVISNALGNAEASLNKKNYDEAYKTITPYLAFAGEVPLIRSIIDSDCDDHFGRAKAAEEQQNWEEAAAEYRRAGEIKPSPGVADALKNAETQLVASRDHAAADKAVQQSKVLADQQDFIQAYLELDKLPESQRALVENERNSLQQNFVTAAFQRAQKLQDLHIPIKGRSDEDFIRQAYSLLYRAAPLSTEPNVKLKLDLLSDKISGYYLDLAKRYLEKPNASGIGLGWYFLDTAKQYKSDLEPVRDQKNRYKQQFQVRSRLSIGIEFRDQTSRREAAGYADQLADAIAVSLENSGIVVSRKDNPTPIPPNFVIVGEIIQDKVVTVPHIDTLQSKFRSIPHNVQNPEWIKADRELEAAKKDQQEADQVMNSALGRNKKKEIDEAKAALSAANKKLEDARNKRDSLQPQISEDTILPYNYTKTTYNMQSVVELGFRITDNAGRLVEPTVQVNLDNPKTFVVLDNVKPEDTESVKMQDKLPPENPIREELEIQARNELVKKVKEKVATLPQKILDEARRRASEKDFDAAAEQYILYLNATPEDDPNRDEANKFLQDNFRVAMKNVT
ncbi:MAG TPA: hypothetical protein VGK01_14930 [Candidatus Angelobacter sp.]